jgi:hypothetical protein
MTELQRCILAKEKGFKYCPTTGELIGLNGKVRTTKNAYGYISVNIYADKVYQIKGHRLAWYLHYGKLPINVIDHIDGDRANNKIKNLRDVTRLENQWNFIKKKGYGWHKASQKYRAYITVNGKLIHLGLFLTKEESVEAYLTAKAKYHVISTNNP